jgi:FHA domain-containing protein
MLDRLETRLERIVEGSVGALFRTPLQPAEIGGKLERAMLAGQVAGPNGRIAPNDYRVGMHPDDMVRFADYIAALCRQLERWLADVAAERGLTFVDRVGVRIEGDTAAPRRGVTVCARILDRGVGDDAAGDERQRAELARVIHDVAGIAPLRLVVDLGEGATREFILRRRSTTVGRASDNDIVLPRPDVSRHHARFDYRDDAWRLVDLGSTNGTTVNGRGVTEAPVAAGDVVRFGSTRASLRALAAVRPA